MEKNSIYTSGDSAVRVLAVKEDRLLVIDCVKLTMPRWVTKESLDGYDPYKEGSAGYGSCKERLAGYKPCTEEELQELTGAAFPEMDSLDAECRKRIRERFTMVAGILPFVGVEAERSKAIALASEQWGVSKQTVRSYLCRYLAYRDIRAFAPHKRADKPGLTRDQKNMRWALNKYFYNYKKNSLMTAYTLLLKEKYCDGEGNLIPGYPSFYQFRYFYRKTKNIQNYLISRNGLKDYQRNSRPLTGGGIQEFAPHVGVGMLDATVCDIYLVDDAGKLIGRPILTACIDAYSGLCEGYFLSWEGGVYSLRGLFLNVVRDKAELCLSHGIQIKTAEWDCSGAIPAVLVTDRGSEYISQTVEQITELGVTIINLPSFRAELKSPVEKFFDLVQESYKPYLKGKGVVEPDYRERGAHDYRKDACLTMAQFEQVLLHCIYYYNSKRIMENYPYTDAMLAAGIAPHASDIWNFGLAQEGCNRIPVSPRELTLTLLPRAEGKFTRYGFKVNGLRYHHEDYAEKYLAGGTATAAYNPEDVSYIWLMENGAYVRFALVEGRFEGLGLTGVRQLRDQQKALVKAVSEDTLKAKVALAAQIEAVAHAASSADTDVKGVRKVRQRERDRRHLDYVKEGGINA